MKFVILIALIPLNLFSQKANEWRDNYDHWHGSYEDDYNCNKLYNRKEKKSINEFPYGQYCGFLTVSLDDIGRYRISLECSRQVGDTLVVLNYEFSGTYTVDAVGNVKLTGTHPFSSNDLEIQESYRIHNGHKFLTGRGFFLCFQ